MITVIIISSALTMPRFLMYGITETSDYVYEVRKERGVSNDILNDINFKLTNLYQNQITVDINV